MSLSGILSIDKPAGWTSFDVVGFVRRHCGVKRVGHAGTLDPAATGVLPVLIGQATRLTEYLVDATKAYDATIHLGVETDTYDGEGEVVSRSDLAGISRSRVEAALHAFRGDFLQTPPVYSALKRDGVPLYKRARRGEAIEVEPRRVRVDELYITEWNPPLVTLHIECAKGFYVRSLAHDLGAALGVGGMLSALRRTRVGTFRVDEAVTTDALRGAFEAGVWQDFLHAPDEVLLQWPAAILRQDTATRLHNGLRVPMAPSQAVPALCRAYTTEGDFAGVVRVADDALIPGKMFGASEGST